MPELNTAKTVCKNPFILQFSYGVEQANTYVLISGHHAIVVDVCSKSITEELKRRELTPYFVILTHEHVDHLWGLNALRKQFQDVRVIAQEFCSKAIGNTKINKAAQYRIYATLRFGESYQNEEAKNRNYCCTPAEVTFSESYDFEWKGHLFRVAHTPGHSPGSCIIFMDETIAFSGDTLLNEDTFLKFDGGDETLFSTVTVPVINSIKDEMIIFPGHGEPFIKRDWKKSNG